MHWLDTTILALLAIGAGLGAWCGFVWQVARVLNLALSFSGAVFFHPPATRFLQECVLQGADIRIIRAAAYTGVFLVIYLTLLFFTRLLRNIIRAVELESFDRLLGALVGAGKMALVIGAICLGLASYKHPKIEALLSQSIMAPAFVDGMEMIVLMVPEDYKTRLSDNLQNLRDLSRTFNDRRALNSRSTEVPAPISGEQKQKKA